MATMEGAPVRKHKQNNKNYSETLWLDIKPQSDRHTVLSAGADNHHSKLQLNHASSKQLSARTVAKGPNLDCLLVPKAANIREKEPPSRSNIQQKNLLLSENSARERTLALESFTLKTEMDIESLLLLQLQSKKLDNILENLGSLSNKIPEMTSCDCDCAGSPGNATPLPVTLDHLKSNIERLKEDGTSNKEIVVAVFTAIYSGLQVRF